jgi:hypothetical protein
MILLRDRLRHTKVEEPIRSISGRSSEKRTNITSR